ncbi:nucleotidyltransferase domain-containing protein [Ureibacillus terrenus]|uniref:nucleotidyltransferase domain-containing protein n=1 Tax=Ureibacillus terrenus TaxID=118246 RepID=UPI002E1FA7CF|nr:nucleotidyltransferase domain-containing protein [Ureibacillus terrenus]
MEEKIRTKLKEIEQTYQVKVLFAVESGSRAWGLASRESDYEVRFVYIHPLDWYLSIDPHRRDVIELPISDQLDISGWEITKALRLFRKSNPAILEWIRSKAVYVEHDQFIAKLRRLEKDVFHPKSVLSHYIQIAKKNYASLHGKEAKLKNYLYAFCSLLASKWIVQFNEIPPVDFRELLERVKLDSQLGNELEQLAAAKIHGDERKSMQPDPVLNEYIRKELDWLSDTVKLMNAGKKDPTAKLNKLFRETLIDVWKENFVAYLK